MCKTIKIKYDCKHYLLHRVPCRATFTKTSSKTGKAMPRCCSTKHALKINAGKACFGCLKRKLIAMNMELRDLTKEIHAVQDRKAEKTCKKNIAELNRLVPRDVPGRKAMNNVPRLQAQKKRSVGRSGLRNEVKIHDIVEDKPDAASETPDLAQSNTNGPHKVKKSPSIIINPRKYAGVKKSSPKIKINLRTMTATGSS